MSADEHLNPSQFGFTEGSHEDWMAAQEHYGVNRRQGRIDLSKTELHTGQPKIWLGRVQEYVDKPGLASHTGQDLPVEVYHHGGKLWLGEGHHRVAAAKIRGQKTVRAEFHG